MADENSTSRAFAPHVVSAATTNWGAQVPALIVNPAAKVEDLLGWCAVEAAELEQFATMLSCSRADVQFDPESVAARFQHRLGPLAQVLDYAASIAGARSAMAKAAS